MKIKNPDTYHSKKRQVDMIEKKLVSNAHSYGWSQIKTARALLEGLLKVRIRFKSSKQLDVYHLIFALNFKEADLKVFNPEAFDKEFILRSKEID